MRESERQGESLRLWERMSEGVGVCEEDCKSGDGLLASYQTKFLGKEHEGNGNDRPQDVTEEMSNPIDPQCWIDVEKDSRGQNRKELEGDRYCRTPYD